MNLNSITYFVNYAQPPTVSAISSPTEYYTILEPQTPLINFF